MLEAIYLFYTWFFFGIFQGYDLHNCSFYGGGSVPVEVTCGPPHTHEPEPTKTPLSSTRQRTR